MEVVVVVVVVAADMLLHVVMVLWRGRATLAAITQRLEWQTGTLGRANFTIRRRSTKGNPAL